LLIADMNARVGNIEATNMVGPNGESAWNSSCKKNWQILNIHSLKNNEYIF
jgi:hypothetical protein